MRCLSFAAVIAALAVAVRGQDASPAKIAGFHFSGRTLGGQPIAQSAFQDSVLIVDLWGTWCPPCREAIPELVRLYERFKHRGLEIVGFCYTNDGGPEDADKVRAFAVDKRVTYSLVPGTADVRDQVPGFRGYPTLLLFRRGLVHEKTLVGFDADTGKDLEQWVERALGVDDKAGDHAAGGEPAARPEDVPAGRVFVPGNGDHGFDLDVTDIRGQTWSFAHLRGHSVLLALTTSWDENAAGTASFLESVRKEAPAVDVVAWHLEKERDQGAKEAAVRSFVAAQKVGYRAFATDLAVARAKVHRFAALPTMLLFDGEGVLVYRAGGISDEIERQVRDAITNLARAR